MGWPHGCVPPARPGDPCHHGGRGTSTTHVRKGEALRHHGGLTCGDREPMLVRRGLSSVAQVHLRWVSGCWRNGADRPVLKHGPRSLTRARVSGWQTWARSESRGQRYGCLRWEGGRGRASKARGPSRTTGRPGFSECAEESDLPRPPWVVLERNGRLVSLARARGALSDRKSVV